MTDTQRINHLVIPATYQYTDTSWVGSLIPLLILCFSTVRSESVSTWHRSHGSALVLQGPIPRKGGSLYCQ